MNTQKKLLCLSLLALLNAESACAADATDWTLASQTIHEADCQNDWDSLSYLSSAQENVTLSTAKETFLHLRREPDSQAYELNLLNLEEGSLSLKGEAALTASAEGVSLTALKTEGLLSLQGHSLTIKAHALGDEYTTSRAWYLTGSNNDVLPQALLLSAESTGDATALYLQSSAFEHAGQFVLEAVGADAAQSEALRLMSSDVTLTSTGGSRLTGEIVFDEWEGSEPSRLHLVLAHPDDLWQGSVRTTREGEQGARELADMRLTLSNGARWQPGSENALKTFDWKEGGILDISEARAPVQIGLRGQSDIDNDHVTVVETGAVLRVDITDSDIGTGSNGSRYKLNIEEVHAAGGNAQITVQIIDRRVQTAGQTENLDIGLIRFNTMQGGVHFQSERYRYETALGTYETYAEFGSADDLGTVINAIGTERVGNSTLADNFTDFVSTAAIAAERVAAGNAKRLTERFDPEKRGLWADIGYEENELKYDDRSRLQTLKSESVTVGYDHEVTLPFLDNAFAGLWAGFTQSDVEMHEGSGSIDQASIGAYAGGRSADGRKMLLSAFYINQASDFESAAFAADDRTARRIVFSPDARAYGAGLFIGQPLMPQDSSYRLEPYLAAQTYRVRFKDARNEDIVFHGTTLGESLIELGLKAGYASKDPETAWALTADLAWVHRISGSETLRGSEAGASTVFQTEDLQESWGEASLGAHYAASDRLAFSLTAQSALAKEVRQKYAARIHARYRF